MSVVDDNAIPGAHRITSACSPAASRPSSGWYALEPFLVLRLPAPSGTRRFYGPSFQVNFRDG